MEAVQREGEGRRRMGRRSGMALGRLWVAAAMLAVGVVGVAPPIPREALGEVQGVCGGCSDLARAVTGMSADEIGARADQMQQKGEVARAAAAMCGGICASTLVRDAQAFANLGVLLKALGHPHAAVSCYRASLRLNPSHAVQHYRLGNSLMGLQEFSMARASYLLATARMPAYGDAYNNLGNCLMNMARWDEAERAYEHAVKSDPRDANYYCNLGGVVARRDVAAAIELLRKGLALNPAFGEVYNNLANYLRDQGRLGEARDAYGVASDLMRDSGEVLVNLASTQAYLCDWRRRAATRKRLLTLTNDELGDPRRHARLRAQRHSGGGSSVSLGPFYASAFGFPPLTLKRIAEAYARDASDRVGYLRGAFSPAPPAAPVRGVLRLGIVSSDLTNHIVGHGVRALLGALDGRRFDVSAYPLTADDGSAARRGIARLARVTDVAGWSAEAVARKINADALHVLLDLNGHTKGNLIDVLALRPCGTQVLFHGYAGTAGAPYVQHFVTDRTVVPPEHASHLTEKLLMMPHSFFLWEDYGSPLPIQNQPSYRPPDLAQVSPLLPSSSFVFCCFNNLYKVSPAAFQAWMRILNATQGSVLWMMKMPPGAEERLWEEARERGIDPERIVFSDLFSREEHMRIKSGAQLLLDTMVYNAHSTAADSLAAGVPILSLPGASMVARVGASLLKNAGMSLLIARKTTDYVDMAIQAARQGGTRAEGLSHKLRTQLSSSPLFDREGWTRDFEALLRSSVDMESLGDSRSHYAGATKRAAHQEKLY